MFRKFVLFCLFLFVCAGLYLLLSAENSTPVFSFSIDGVHPSEQHLPSPWVAQTAAAVRLRSAVAGAESGAACPDVYQVQKGDTAGTIAQRCGLSVAELQAANPTLGNLNLIYAGEEINLVPVSQTGNTAAREIKSAAPGSTVTVEVTGFSPDTAVRLGLGLSQSGYQILKEARTDGEGKLTMPVTIPAGAEAGERAFVLVTTIHTPVVQAISPSFQITR
jgi:hypothetical protein